MDERPLHPNAHKSVLVRKPVDWINSSENSSTPNNRGPTRGPASPLESSSSRWSYKPAKLEGACIPCGHLSGCMLCLNEIQETSSKFTWTIKNFSTLNTVKHFSDVFTACGYKWRLLIFPKGNNVKFLSVYVDVADSANLPYGWGRFAEFDLSVVNQMNGRDTAKMFVMSQECCGTMQNHPAVDLPLSKFTWTIRNFSRLNMKKHYSESFQVGGYKCLCKTGKLDNAVEYFNFCKESSVLINAMFYSSLIDGLGKAGRVDETEKLFDEMVDKGCTRDSYCYNALIDTFAKCGKMDEALMLFKRMEEEGCDQTVYTCTILISGLFKEHRNEEALKSWLMELSIGGVRYHGFHQCLEKIRVMCLNSVLGLLHRPESDLTQSFLHPTTAFSGISSIAIHFPISPYGLASEPLRADFMKPE
ncbi:hypothetical protein IFM89_023965 [Coptis chinensis]|uniref:MATH domain-containing protein n=1 Tax=Coptis chinensis TaxID=261450 RepID=A0A835LWE5_9MAGN|nr:hypothetical protein IFM89_023965 [Coptis chinensis]